MRYEDAVKIGSAVEGYVRCTYVRMNDSKEGYIYSLQHHDAYKVTEAHLGAEDYFEGERNYGGGSASEEVQETVIEHNADYSVFTEDIPVVKAVAPFAAWGKTKMIECKLTDYARDLIKKRITSDYRKQKKYLVEKVWWGDAVESNVKKSESGSVESGEKILHKAGERKTMVDTWDKNTAYTEAFMKYGCPAKLEEQFLVWYKTMIATGGQAMGQRNPLSESLTKSILGNPNKYMYVITEYYPTITGHFNELQEQCLANVLDKNATFIVKECAIDWFPTKIDGAFITDSDGKLITIDAALLASRKRLDRAKAILAAASTYAIF